MSDVNMIRWLLILAISGSALQAQETVFHTGLVLRVSEHPRRAPFHTDAVEAVIVRGEWMPPVAGQPLAGVTNQVWLEAVASSEGVFTNRELSGGYLDCAIFSQTNDVRLLSAAGHEVVYVNGEPHAGDPYFNGILRLPVKLRAGSNDFLFRVNRGRLKAKLFTPSRLVFLYLGDITTPDIVHGEREPQWAAVVVVNCTTNALKGLWLEAAVDGHRKIRNPVPVIPPLSARKVGFRFQPHWSETTNRLEMKLTLTSPAHKPLDLASLELALRREQEHYKLTFLSQIDGSVQYYAVAPALRSPAQPAPEALFLSLHGAGVEASGQAAAYQSKPWGTVVAPTNRRDYGFDWEDWGRRDALEALDLAIARFKPDPHQVYLTGHSMGGHGTWHIGVTYPDRFGAIAPSAGWISWFSYGGAERAEASDAMGQMLERASNPLDTLALVTNCLHFGVYILHGIQDDNVPVREARVMRQHLETFHHDFTYHEQPGAGHWWGNQCMDWPPIFDFFARHRRPGDDSVVDINFTTFNPGVSASFHWVRIYQQLHALEKSAVVAHYDPIHHAIEIASENVARLALDLAQIAPNSRVSATLDGQKIEDIGGERVWFENNGRQWSHSAPPPSLWKGPLRYGPFREAFANRMVFVYGTKGSSEENAWAAAKSRFDAESWWYRSNGSVDVIPDVEFDPIKEPNRAAILYGNADINSAWVLLLGNSPVQVRRGVVEVGAHVFHGDSLACLFCRPRRGSNRACVAVVSGTGLVGLKLTDRVPYLGAGLAYPDCTVFDVETLSQGTAGVRAAGFFGMDWGVATGDFVWHE